VGQPPTETPPAVLDSAMVFAPVGQVAVEAFNKPGESSRLVLAGMYVSPIGNLSYYLHRVYGVGVTRLVKPDSRRHTFHSRSILYSRDLGIT